MKPAHALSLAVILICLSIAASGQTPVTGTPPFGSFGGGPDIINLANLNAHLSIPVLQKAGRGMPFTYVLSYDTLIWTPVSVSGVLTWQPVSNWGWTTSTQVTTGYVTYSKTMYTCNYEDHSKDVVYSNYVFYDYFGAPHQFDLYIDIGECGNGSFPATATATDGSGYTITTQTGSDATITDRGGRVFSPPVNKKGGSGTATDTNGNQITVNGSGQFFDTLSSTTPVLTISGTAPSPVTFTYTAPSGANATYTMNYQTYTVRTNFGCTGSSAVVEYAATQVSLVSSIQLPDGTSYSFTYEPTPGYSGDVTGRLASVTLPTGGAISYTYTGGSNGIECADGSTAGLNRSTPDTGSTPWQYARTIGSGAASTTTVTDPSAQANQTVINFQGIYETQRQVYQGSNSPGNLMETLNTCYNGSTSPCTGTAITLPITQRTVTAQWSGGSPAEVNTLYNSYGLVTEIDEYDYGVSSPTRKTLVTYASLQNNINSSYYTVKVYDGSGNLKAETTYAYDQTGVTTTSGTPQHISVSGSRGNLTSILYWTTSNTTIQKTFTYYDTGTLTTAVDVNNATMTYTYSSTNNASCGNSFPTGTSITVNSVNLTRSMAWNCTGGVQTSLYDENGQTTSITYNDKYFWRPNSTTDQLQNVTSMTYNPATPSTPASVESVLPFNGGNSAVDILTTLDSLGRTHVSQTRQAPGSPTFDSAETDYDSLGRVSRTTVPYSGTAGQTNSSAPATTLTYDVLSRPYTTTDGGGGTLTNTYTQNDVLSALGPAPSGENTKRRQFESDGLGRLTKVCELTSLSGSGTCGQVSSPTGYWTEYSYDALNDIISVTQNAQSSATQSRTFGFDFLGRLTSESNPESGTTSYTYDADGTCGTYDGDLVKRVDAVGNTTCYTYDALHRVISIAYKSGPYSGSSITPTKCYVYDSATVNSQTMTYTATRLAEAYTTSASSCPSTSKISDIGFSYSKRGELTDVYESTPHSGGYYHSTVSYWANGALNTLNPLNSTALPTLTYGADGEGRPNTVGASSGTNPVLSVGYCPTTGCNNNTALVGQLTGLTFGTYDSDAFQYDPNTGRATQYTFTVGSTPQTVTGKLGWNANSTLASLAITDQFNSGNTQSCSFSYDDLARIAGNPNGSGPYGVDCGTSTWRQYFTYDPFGNITKNVPAGATGTSFQPTYDTTTNHITAFSGLSCMNGNTNTCYDANGNTLRDGLHTYAWDADGNSITIDAIGLTFDALDRMVEQQNGSAYTQILYGPTGKLALMNGQNLTKAFVPLPAGATAVYTSGPTLSYFRHPDWLGSSRFASTASRTMQYSGAYAPFGENYAEAGTTDRSFTGENQDTTQGTTTGLYDFLFREYAQYGRWISPDPAGLGAVDPTNPQSWNRYAYVLNNPMNAVDPLGLDDCETTSCFGLLLDGSGGAGLGSVPLLWPWDPFTGCLTYDVTCWMYHIPGPGQMIGCSLLDVLGQNGDGYSSVLSCGIQNIMLVGPGNRGGAANNVPCLAGAGPLLPGQSRCGTVIVSCTAVKGVTDAVSHCGITVGGCGNGYTRFDAMPSGNPLWSTITVQKTSTGATPYAPGNPIYTNGNASCGTVQCVSDVMATINSGQYPYSAPLQNSNTAAAWTTNACGISAIYPTSAIGAHVP